MKSHFKGVIFDISGVLEFKGETYPGAIKLVDTLRQKGIIIRIVTNSTLRSRKNCAIKLNQMGFKVYEKEVITASYATACYLKKVKPKSCWIMLEGDGLDEFSAFNQDHKNPEYIVLGDYRDGFNFQNMNKALKCLQAGSKLVVMIPEMVDNSMGDVELTVGAYGKMLEKAAEVQATYLGKPNKYIFDMTLKTMDIQRHDVLMVGDKIATDIFGAKLAGIKSVLVKSGEFRESDLDGDVQPDYIVDSIQDIEDIFLQ